MTKKEREHFLRCAEGREMNRMTWVDPELFFYLVERGTLRSLAKDDDELRDDARILESMAYEWSDGPR